MATVLIADDDEDHRLLLEIALRRFGHDAVAASDCDTAEAMVAAGGVDLLLLDVRMPGESGIEFCRRLRDTPAGATLPIMFVTADVNDRRIQAAIDAGADDYLTKPFHRAELAARMDNLLLRRSAPADRSAPAAQAAMLAARHALHRPVREAGGPALRIA